MRKRFQSISKSLARVKWRKCDNKMKRRATRLLSLINDDWPLADKLRTLLRESTKKEKDKKKLSVGEHIGGVVASVNELLPKSFNTLEFFGRSGLETYDKKTYEFATAIHNRCWVDASPLFGSNREYAEGFLRISALYHDYGKLIDDDHHVSRGVHLMRDVNVKNREAIEELFENLWEKRFFWTLIRHHDIFGCICTGEASFPALADMLEWTADSDPMLDSPHSALSKMSFLLWLNIADSNSSLIPYMGGITTIEARRYLSDWNEIRIFLDNQSGIGNGKNREEFKHWALEKSGHPEMTIKRISRLIATCHRVVVGSLNPKRESEIQALVEEELQALLGPRFERFCYRFARFCKFDYALRFFYQLMRVSIKDKKNPGQKELRYMVMMTCSVLCRIVEEYGQLVDNETSSGTRLGVDMSNLMNPNETGEAICSSLQETPAGALWWIIDEISVWLYGE